MAPASSHLRVTAFPATQLDAALTRDIDALALVSAEPNPFHESWMLRPALAHLDAPKLMLVCVRDESATLTGLFPMQLTPRYRGLPLRTLRSWEHDYLFLGSPLIAAGDPASTWGAVLDWIESRDSPASILELVGIRDDGPVGTALRTEIARRPHLGVYAQRRERAMFDPIHFKATGISGKHHKELRRQERRLGELGAITYRSLSAESDAIGWIERFLALESSGWKGQLGTALNAHAASRAFFKDTCMAAHERGQLQMFEMVVAEQPIAMKCNFTSHDGVFMFKIAYDETYAKYSPGLLLELFGMQQLLLSDRRIAWADSCAKTEHFMAERLWPERRRLGDYSISGRSVLARAIIRHGGRVRAIRRRVKRLLLGG